MTSSLTYFKNIGAGDQLLTELDDFIHFDRRGWCNLRDLHNSSNKDNKPVSFYKNNPLVKAVMAEYPA